MFVKASIVCLLAVAVYGDVSSLGNSREYLPPKTTSGYGYPTPSKPFPPPTQPPYRPPPTQPPYRPPVTQPPYRPPVTQPPYRPPVTQPPYQPPPTNYGPPSPPPTFKPTPPPYRPPTPTYGPPLVPGGTSPQGGRVPGPGEPGHVHIPGAPYDFKYAVKDDQYGTDFSHNAVSDGDQVKGEWRVLMPDGRTQIVTYIADWATGFHPQIRYEGEIKPYVAQPSNQGYNYQKPNPPPQQQGGNDGYRY